MLQTLMLFCDTITFWFVEPSTVRTLQRKTSVMFVHSDDLLNVYKTVRSGKEEGKECLLRQLKRA